MNAKEGDHIRQTIAFMGLCGATVLIGFQARADDTNSRCAQIGQNRVNYWNCKDVQTASDMFSHVFTEDTVYSDVPTEPTNPVAEGRDELLAFASGIFYAFLISSFELGQSACQGQQGFFEWTWIAKDGSPGFCQTGKPFTVRGVAVIEIQGNRISRESDFWDLATVLRQLMYSQRLESALLIIAL